MDFVVAAVVEAVVEASERHYRERIRLKRLRDRSNPFDLPEPKFKKMFRVPRSGARFIIDSLDDPRLDEGSIPKTIKVLGALKFFAQGSYQTSIGQDNFLGMSQPTMSRCLTTVADGIVTKLAPQYVKFPTTEAEKDMAKAEFYRLYKMPDTLGAVDGTHVAITKPPLNHPTAPGNLFYNSKGFYSINCQVVCSGSGKIIAINPNFPGSTHDADIWTSSKVYHHLETEFVRGSSDQWLLGDTGYPLQPWLMTPLTSTSSPEEEAYNACHFRARNIVEITIGRLKSTFKCLDRHGHLHYMPTKCAKIIIACCTLYNMYSDQFSDEEDLEADDDQPAEDSDIGLELDFLVEAEAVRHRLIKNHFSV